MSNHAATIHVSYYVYASAEATEAVDVTIDRVQLDDNLMKRLSRRMPGYSPEAIFHIAMQVGMHMTNYAKIRSDDAMSELTVTDHGIAFRRSQPGDPDDIGLYLGQTGCISKEVRILTTLAADVLSDWTGIAIATLNTQLQYDRRMSEEMKLSQQLDQCVAVTNQHARLLRRTIVAALLLAILTIILTIWLGNGLLLLALTAGFLIIFYCWPSHRANQQRRRLWLSFIDDTNQLWRSHPEWKASSLDNEL